jgi:hypothetical protein
MVADTPWPVALRYAAILVLFFAAGCTTVATPAYEQARMRALRTELLARGDPDSVATAAFIERLATGAWHDAPDLAARATTAAPDRADLAFQQLLLCYQMPSCKPEPLEAHLRVLDPMNGITWLSALGRATRANDAASARTALEGLAQAQRVDLYWTKLVSRMTAAITGLAGYDQSAAFVAVVGIDAAMATPPLQPVSRSCSRTAIADTEVLARCRRIAAAFEHADSILFESYGNHLAASLWPENSTEGNAIAARRRVLDYQVDLWSVKQKELNSRKAARTLATLMGQYPSEQQAFLALYAKLGLNPDPPADWKKPEPHG